MGVGHGDQDGNGYMGTRMAVVTWGPGWMWSHGDENGRGDMGTRIGVATMGTRIDARGRDNSRCARCLTIPRHDPDTPINKSKRRVLLLHGNRSRHRCHWILSAYRISPIVFISKPRPQGTDGRLSRRGDGL